MSKIAKLTAALSALSLSSAFAGTMAPPMDKIVEETTTLGASVSVGYDSDYIFRGVKFAEQSVWAQIDYSYSLAENLSLDVGAWYETSAADQYDELDLWAGISTSFGPIDFSAGFLWYYFPEVGSGVDSDTQELFYALSYELPYEIALGFQHSYDFVPDGHWFSLTLGKSFPLTDKISLDLGAGISYISDYFIEGSGWNNVDLSAGLSIALTDNATLAPYIAYSHALEALEDNGVDNYLYGGVSLSVSF